MIRAVVFDFGNVLCFPPADEKVQEASRFCGMDVPQFLQAFWNERLDYDAGLLEPERYWAGVIGPEFAAKHLSELIRIEIGFWNQYDERPFRWIASLRAAGIRIGILSNLPRAIGEALRADTFLGKLLLPLDHFDHVTMSNKLRCVKPQAEIYRYSCEGLGVAPGEVMFLDDKLPNVEGAIEIGMRAELYTTWEEFLDRRIPFLYGLPKA